MTPSRTRPKSETPDRITSIQRNKSKEMMKITKSTPANAEWNPRPDREKVQPQLKNKIKASTALDRKLSEASNMDKELDAILATTANWRQHVATYASHFRDQRLRRRKNNRSTKDSQAVLLTRKHRQPSVSDFADFWICCSLSKNKRHVFFFCGKSYLGGENHFQKSPPKTVF